MIREDAFRAIADPTRRQIMAMLSTGPKPVHQIWRNFDMSRPAISKHLRVLTEAGLLRTQRCGKENRYEVQAAALDEVVDWLTAFWSPRLQLLKRLAEGDS